MFLERKRCGACLSHLEQGRSRRKRVVEELPIPPPCDLHLLIEEEEEVEGGTLAALDSLENLEEDQDEEMEDASQAISPTFLPQTLNLQQKDSPSQQQQESLSQTFSPTLLPQTLHLQQKEEPPKTTSNNNNISPTPTLLPHLSIPQQQQQKPPTIGVTPSGARFQSIGLSPCLSLDNSLSLSRDGTHSNLSLSPPMTLQEDDELPLIPNRFTPKPLPTPTKSKPIPTPTKSKSKPSPPPPDLSPLEPSLELSIEPTLEPSPLEPAIEPTLEPSIDPTLEPSPEPSIDPTLEPSIDPTLEPSPEPALLDDEPTFDMTIPIEPLPKLKSTPKPAKAKASTKPPPPKPSPKPKPSPTKAKTSTKPPPPKASPKKTPQKEFKEPQRRPSPQQITPSRKSRRIQHTSSSISLSSLISCGILSPRDELILFDHTGVLTADGWIEYHYDKYPTIEVWARAVATRAKKKKQLKLTNPELFGQIEVKFLDNSQNTLRTCSFSECVDIFQGQTTVKDIAPHPTPILTLSRSIEELIPSDMDESYEEFDDSGAGEDEEPTVILREETQEEDIIEELEEFDEFDEFDEDESSKGSQKQTMSKLEEKAKEREPVNTKKVVEKKVDKSEKEEIPSQESQEEPVKRDTTVLNTTPIRAKRRQKRGPLTPRRQHFRFTDMTQDNWEPYERQLKEVDFMLDEWDSQSQSQNSDSLSAAKLPSMALDSSGDGSIPSQISVLSGDLWSPSRDDMEED